MKMDFSVRGHLFENRRAQFFMEDITKRKRNPEVLILDTERWFKGTPEFETKLIPYLKDMQGAHLAHHSSNLSLSDESDEDDGNCPGEYVVENVIKCEKKSDYFEYRIDWGIKYGEDQYSWERAENLLRCEKFDEFLQLGFDEAKRILEKYNNNKKIGSSNEVSESNFSEALTDTASTSSHENSSSSSLEEEQETSDSQTEHSSNTSEGSQIETSTFSEGESSSTDSNDISGVYSISSYLEEKETSNSHAAHCHNGSGESQTEPNHSSSSEGEGNWTDSDEKSGDSSNLESERHSSENFSFRDDIAVVLSSDSEASESEPINSDSECSGESIRSDQIEVITLSDDDDEGEIQPIENSVESLNQSAEDGTKTTALENKAEDQCNDHITSYESTSIDQEAQIVELSNAKSIDNNTSQPSSSAKTEEEESARAELEKAIESLKKMTDLNFTKYNVNDIISFINDLTKS